MSQPKLKVGETTPSTMRPAWYMAYEESMAMIGHGIRNNNNNSMKAV